MFTQSIWLLPAFLSFSTPVVAEPGDVTETESPGSSGEYRDLFPPYIINAIPPSGQPGSRGIPSDEAMILYEMVFRSYPSHTWFQLEHELVERQENPELVMDLLSLRPGGTVADIGCGSGFFTSAFAKLVGPTGRVFAIDIQQKAVEYLWNRLQQNPDLNPYDNITLKVSKVDDCMLDESSLDTGLLSHADFYMFPGLLDEGRAMLESLFRAFKVGGHLVIVQFLGLDPNTNGDNIVRNVESVGFKNETAIFVREQNVWYGVFSKPPRVAAP